MKDLSYLTLTNFAVFVDSEMAVLEESLSVVASVYKSLSVCSMRHITTRGLFIMFFRSEIYLLDTFYSFLFNISGQVYQNVLLLFGLI